MPSGTLERTSYQPPSTRIESSPPTAERSYEQEEPNPLLTVVFMAMGALLLILAVWVIWTVITWLLLHLWIAAALALFLLWVAAVCLAWMIEMKWHSVCIAVFGAAIITLGVLSYTTYQSWTERKPDVQMLGR
jgi:hypothetical protein